jgi:hypothetical protein
MADFHAQAGNIVRPIATLGEEIGAKGQETLRNVARQVQTRTRIQRLKTFSKDWRVLSALGLGILAGLWLYSRSDRD